MMRWLIIVGVMVTVSACSMFKGGEASYPQDPEDARRARHGKLTGDEGIKLLGRGKGDKSGGATIGVNSFLWRASLDTLSFMPLAQVDPLGGVIITDWYEDPSARGERFKVNVTILGTNLTANGVRVAAFKQKRGEGGQWRDATIGTDVASDLEKSILTRARELRIQAAKLGE